MKWMKKSVFLENLLIINHTLPLIFKAIIF
jgi:hypothetical protein